MFFRFSVCLCVFSEEDLTELRGEGLYFRLRISRATNLPSKFSKDCFVNYKFFLDEQTQKTKHHEGISTQPIFDYERTIHIDIGKTAENCQTVFIHRYILASDV